MNLTTNEYGYLFFGFVCVTTILSVLYMMNNLNRDCSDNVIVDATEWQAKQKAKIKRKRLIKEIKEELRRICTHILNLFK